MLQQSDKSFYITFYHIKPKSRRFHNNPGRYLIKISYQYQFATHKQVCINEEARSSGQTFVRTQDHSQIGNGDTPILVIHDGIPIRTNKIHPVDLLKNNPIYRPPQTGLS